MDVDDGEHCIARDDDPTGVECTKVALFYLVMSDPCEHLTPYPLCMEHKDLVVKYLSQPLCRMECGRCSHDPGVIVAAKPIGRNA